MLVIDRSKFITGLGGGLLSASSVPGNALASTVLSKAAAKSNSSGGSVVFSVAIYDDMRETSSLDSAVLNHDSTYTKWTGNNAGNTVKGSANIQKISNTLLNAMYSVSLPGKSASGTLVKKTSSDGLQVQVTGSGSGSMVSYTINPATHTAVGTCIAGNQKLNLNSTGLFSSTGGITGAHVSVSGSLNGAFTTTFSQPQSIGAKGNVFAPDGRHYITDDPYAYFSSLFDTSALVLGLIPGMQPFAMGCAIIGGGIGLWAVFAK